MRKLLYAIVLVTAYIWPTHAIFANLDIAQSNSDSNASYTVAGIYWLPDYLKDNVDTNQRSETDKGGGDLPVECKNYSPSCSTPKILGGKKVRIGNIFCAIECICPSSYSTTKCGGEYTLRGSPCTYNGTNYYQGCDPKPCSSAGYFDSSSQTGKICSAVTYGGRSCYSCADDPCYNLTDHSNEANCKNYGCQTKYAACTSKCQTCYSDNCHVRNAVNAPYGCKDYFADCSSKCQTAYPDNCHNRTDNKTDYGCNKYWTDCASKCETGTTCTTTDCSAYKLTSIPANANYTSCTPGCGNSTTTYKLVSCKTDYTDDGKGGCRAKTCAEKDANTKPCGSTCIAKTACCGGCPTGQTCSNGTCVNNKTPEQICEEKGYTLNTYCDEYQAMFYNYCPENRRYTSCYQDCEKFYNNAVAAINGYNSAINNGNIYYYKCGTNTSKCTDTITYRGVTYKYFTLDYNYVCVTKYNEVKKYFNNAIAYCSRTVPIAYECPSRGMACNNYGYMAGGRELIIGTEACCCSCSGSGTPNGQCYGTPIAPVDPTGTGGGTSTT